MRQSIDFYLQLVSRFSFLVRKQAVLIPGIIHRTQSASTSTTSSEANQINALKALKSESKGKRWESAIDNTFQLATD